MSVKKIIRKEVFRMMEKTATVQLLPQEQTGEYQFSGQIVMTSNFSNIFDGNIFTVVLGAMELIRDRIDSEGADYFQVLTCMGKKFWVLDDIKVVTFLMPEDY
jgi:hypothetical protein